MTHTMACGSEMFLEEAGFKGVGSLDGLVWLGIGSKF